jgi:hypothetical protein
MVSAVALVPVSAVALVNVWSNRDGHGRVRNVLGMASGVAGVWLGALAVSDPLAPRSVGAATVAVGAMSTYLSTRGFLHHRQVVSAERRATRARLTIAPAVSATEGAGMAISIRF